MSSKASSRTHPSSTSAPRAGESGLEAGVVFVMVVVFLGIVFLNTYYSHDGLDDGLTQARIMMERGDYSSALVQVEEVLSHYPAHESAKLLEHEIRQHQEAKREELRQEREQAEDNARRLAELETSIAQVTAERDGLIGTRRALEMNLSQTQSALSDLGHRYEELRAATAEQRAASQKLLADATAQLETLETKNDEAMARTIELSQTLGTRIATLTEDLEKSQQQAQEAATAQEAAETQHRAAESELNKAMQDLEHMRAAHGALQRSAASTEDEAQALVARLAERETTLSTTMDRLLADAKKSHDAGDHATGMLIYGYALVMDPDSEPARKGHAACKKALEEAENLRREAEELRREAEEEKPKEEKPKEGDKKDDF